MKAVIYHHRPFSFVVITHFKPDFFQLPFSLSLPRLPTSLFSALVVTEKTGSFLRADPRPFDRNLGLIIFVFEWHMNMARQNGVRTDRELDIIHATNFRPSVKANVGSAPLSYMASYPFFAHICQLIKSFCST